MATIRTLVTRLVLDGKQAFKDLKRYGVEWAATAKIVEVAADRIERAATRAGAAMGSVAAGAASVRAAAGGAGPRAGVGAARRPAADPFGAAIGRANRSKASRAGLAAGAAQVTAATDALGRFATASEKARAKVADLTAQVARNREEMAALRRQAVATGDADGTLAARTKAMAVETGVASQKLAAARRELRAIDGSLIDAVKNSARLRGSFQALSVAAGNLISAGISRGLQGITGALVGSAKAAMDFETALVDIRKVARGSDDTAAGMERIEAGIKASSKALGVMPNQVAALAAQITPVFSGREDIVGLTSDVTKIGVAFGVTGEEAGKFFADTSRGLDLTADQTKTAFGAINELGNELGIKAKDIAEAVTRSSGVLKTSGLSVETGAALNSTLIAAGNSAEVAATGVRTLIARLGAGAAATKLQREAFAALGLSAEDVAAKMSKGGKESEAAIQLVVGQIGKLRAEDRMPVLIELFGSESIGSIGTAATATEKLATAFKIAGEDAGGFNSVLEEYERVTNTSAHRVEKLKANVGVLAIELGNALLPHIDKVVNFLTSSEGQEWGAQAVEKAAATVATLASGLATVVGWLSSLTETFGIAGLAVAGFGLKVAALAGPWGIAAAAAAAAIAAMSMGIGSLLAELAVVDTALNNIAGQVAKIKGDERQEAQDQEDTDILDRRSAMGGLRGQGYAIPDADTASAASTGPAVLGLAEARAARVAAKAAARKAKGQGHKATKMDRQLAALDPSLAGVLRQGGEKDKGGDLKVHDDLLSRGAFAAATSRHGLGGVDGMGGAGVGPGPNITTNDYRTYVNVTQSIDARSSSPVPENIRGAALDMGQKVAGVVFTGARRVAGMRNAGGRMA